MATSHPNSPTRNGQSLRSARGWGAVIAVIFGACGTFLWSTRPRPVRAESQGVSFDAAVAEMRATNDAGPAKPQAVRAAPMSESERAAALGRIARVDRLLRDHARYLGEFPVGTNADIT